MAYVDDSVRPSRKRKSASIEDAVSDSRDATTEYIASDPRDVATEHLSIKIAGYAGDRRRSGLAPSILLGLKYEVEHARHVPVTLAVLEEDGQNPELVQRRTWLGTLEGVSRCTAAYHNAFVAGQPDAVSYTHLTLPTKRIV